MPLPKGKMVPKKAVKLTLKARAIDEMPKEDVWAKATKVKKKYQVPEKMPNALAAITPGTVTRSYDESPRPRKVKNASRNMAAKVTGGLIGSGIAVGVAAPVLRKIPESREVLRVSSKLAGKGAHAKATTVTAGKLKPYVRAGIWGLGGSAGSSFAGSESYRKIRRENKQWQ